MKNKTPITLIDLLAAGGNGSDKSGLITCTWIGKNCAMVACRRDNFSAKVPGQVSADGATKVYSLNRRAVSKYYWHSIQYIFWTSFILKKESYEKNSYSYFIIRICFCYLTGS
jgi:hypothetical protein